MTFFLFIILIIIIVLIYYKFTNIISSQKKQIILMSKQNNQLKTKINSRYSKLKNLTIKYIKPDYSNSITNYMCKLYIAPIDNSFALAELKKDLKLNIIDSAEVLNNIWYEVTFESDDNTNNKGWIKEEFITKINFDAEK